MNGTSNLYVHAKPEGDRTDLFVVGDPNNLTVRQVAIQTLLRVGVIEGVTVYPYELVLQNPRYKATIGWQDSYAYESWWNHYKEFYLKEEVSE